MPNVLTNLFQTKIIPSLYNQFVFGAMSSWMENNAIGVEYRGGKYVLMHQMSVEGLGDYDRNLGYPRGVVTGAKRQYEMKMDRGREFLLDVMDNDETGFLVSAASIMAEFQRSFVIPEVDSYRFSKIYQWVDAEAPDNIDDTAIPKTKIVDTFLQDIAEIRDDLGEIPLVIIMSSLTQRYFGPEFDRSLDYVNFARGALFTKVKAIDNIPFLIVPSARLKTEYTYFDGVSPGDDAKGGFAPAAGAEDMTWMILPMTAPIAVAKIDQPRVFSPLEYQSAHAWKVDYRLFHDLWMLPDGIRATRIRTGAIT